MLKSISESYDAEFYAVPHEVAGDNGSMIAHTGLLHALHEEPLSIKNSVVKPNWRIDDVPVTWD